ncbi:MAG: CIA30 family protein [Planctomycetota bacterium]
MRGSLPVLSVVAVTAVLLVSLTPTFPARANQTIEQDPAPAAEPELQPVLLTDFTDPALNARWAVVNDNVMGGRSDGYLAFEPDRPATDQAHGVMVLTGDINTNGGGFTSVRMSVDPGMLDDPDASKTFAELRAVRITLRGDQASLGRPLALRLEDRVPRRLGINFRIVLPLDPDAPADQWQTLTIPIDQLAPTFRGEPLDPTQWAALDPSQLARVGLILSDIEDGPYHYEIERIELLH